MPTFANRLAVLGLPMIAGFVLAPTALADPPDQANAPEETRHVTVVGDASTTFDVTYHNPDNAEGIASSFKIDPATATGSAQGASRFVYTEVLITNSSGTVLQQGNASGSVGRHHPLVTITYQGVDHPEDTIYRTGFYLPATPSK
jgi:hypothetical protein